MDAGFDEVAIVDLTREDVGIPCVRAVVPGLEVSTIGPSRIGGRAHGIWKGGHRYD